MNIRDTSKITDLAPLANMTTLERVLLTGAFDDVRPLATLPRLTKLDLSYCRVTDCSALQACSLLTTVDLRNTDVSDLGFALALPALTTLGITKAAAASPATIATLRDRNIKINI